MGSTKRETFNRKMLAGKSVGSYNCKERPPVFNAHSHFDGPLDNKSISEKLANHFNSISQEFNGLSPKKVPTA